MSHFLRLSPRQITFTRYWLFQLKEPVRLDVTAMCAQTGHGIAFARMPSTDFLKQHLRAWVAERGRFQPDEVTKYHRYVEGDEAVPVRVPNSDTNETFVASEFNLSRRDYSFSAIDPRRAPDSHASPHRVEPLCDKAGRCNGCSWQHLSHAYQLKLREEHVHGAFAALNVRRTLPSVTSDGDELFHYRTKITPHLGHYDALNAFVGVDKAELADRSEEIPYGFLGSDGRVLNIDNCPIATHAINEALEQSAAEVRAQALAKFLSKKKKKSKDSHMLGVTGVLRESQPTPGKFEALSGPGKTVVSLVNGLRFEHDTSTSFFQANRHLVPMLVDTAFADLKEAHEAQGSSAGALPSVLLDFYCGVGLFTLSAAAHFDRVIGTEMSQTSVTFAKKNAAANVIGNVSFVEGDAEQALAKLDGTLTWSDTAVLVDPPRTGLSEQMVKRLGECQPRYIVYVSCNAQSQARDCARLVSAGYAVDSLRLVNMYPQTPNTESIAILVRHPKTTEIVQ